MEQTLTAVCGHINNHFIRTIERGNFVISSGIINAKEKYLIGQYILVCGSILSDGIYRVNDGLITLDGAADEEFSGAVCGLAIPKTFLEVVQSIEVFQTAAANDKSGSKYISESFGGWAGARAINSKGMIAGWEETFAETLNKWRRMYSEVIL